MIFWESNIADHTEGWLWALTVCDVWYYEDLEEKAHWINQSVKWEAVFRTALATPGLLNTSNVRGGSHLKIIIFFLFQIYKKKIEVGLLYWEKDHVT